VAICSPTSGRPVTPGASPISTLPSSSSVRSAVGGRERRSILIRSSRRARRARRHSFEAHVPHWLRGGERRGRTALLRRNWALPASARALTLAELTCQQAIGTASLRFTKRVHLSELKCENADASGRTCDTATRDQTIADATQKLSVRLAARCADVQLEHLGFP